MEKILLILRLKVLGNFLEKGKVPATTGETKEEGTTLERGCLLLVTMERRLNTQLHFHLNAVALYPEARLEKILTTNF